MENQYYVYDIEVYPNCFCACFLHTVTRERKEFIVWYDPEGILASVNQLGRLLNFLNENNPLIGFNNRSYDDVILHEIPKMLLRKSNGDILITPKMFCQDLKILSDLIIEAERSYVLDTERTFHSLDLFRIWHFNNKAKSMSLKSVEAAIGFENIKDLPYHHTDLLTLQECFKLVDYCWNDVLATDEFLNFENPLAYESTPEKIKLREEMTAKYNIDFMNLPDTGIGERLLLRMVSEAMNIPETELVHKRTPRDYIYPSEFLFDYIDFQTESFRKVHGWFDKMEIDSSLEKEEKKKRYSKSVEVDGLHYEIGLGGCHAARKGVFESTKDKVILSVDVKSYYPNLAIKNRYYPAHLSETFCDIYESIYITRSKIPKSDPNNGVYKLMLNGAYGKSNDRHSFLYDPQYTYTTSINGQLLLLMLAERLTLNGAKMIMVNTDGLECEVSVDKVDEMTILCQEWEHITKLTLEYDKYKKMYIRDVNNYIGVFETGKKKLKGVFEIHKWINKNHSQRIVAIAIRDYVLHGTPVESTILNHQKIEDFFVFIRCKKDSMVCYAEVEGQYIIDVPVQRTNRFLLSNNGRRYYKKFQSGRKDGIFVGHLLEEFNLLDTEKINNVDLDTSYYIKEANKLIRSVEGDKTQLNLFTL